MCGGEQPAARSRHAPQRSARAASVSHAHASCCVLTRAHLTCPQASVPGAIDTAAAAAAAAAVLLSTAVCSRSAAACDSALPCATLGTVSALRALQVSAFLMQCVLGACHHPLACRTPALHMSGAPPAAHQPSASCLLAPCQLRSCRSPVARPSLCQPSQVFCCRPGVAPYPLSALAAVAVMPGSIPGWSPCQVPAVHLLALGARFWSS